MENYYVEIISEIKQNMKDKKYEDARFLIKKELEVPYVPEDIEKELRSLYKECIFYINEKKEDKEESLESLLNKLKGKPQVQLSAADALTNKNLRNCISEIKDWLSKDPQPEAAALIIEALGVQQIDEDFEFVKNGVEYNFSGLDIVPVNESEGFKKANRYLKEWFLHYPDYLNMAHTLLIHEVYTFLPLSYEEEEGYALARMIASDVLDLVEDTKLKEKLGVKNHEKV